MWSDDKERIKLQNCVWIKDAARLFSNVKLVKAYLTYGTVPLRGVAEVS